MRGLHEKLDEWAAGREHGFYPHPVNGREGTALLRAAAERIRELETPLLRRLARRLRLAKGRPSLDTFGGTHTEERGP